MEILRYDSYNNANQIAEEFVTALLNSNEGVKTWLTNTVKEVLNNIKFHSGLILRFSTVVSGLIPVVEGLIKNSTLNIELDSTNIILIIIATLCAMGSTALNKITKKEIRSLLEELKLRGIGNGIIKSLVECFKSITKLLKLILNKTGEGTIDSLLDSISFTFLMAPFMAALTQIITKHKISIDSLPGYLESVGVAIGIYITEHGVRSFIKELKSKSFVNKLEDDLSNNKINPDLTTDIPSLYKNKNVKPINEKDK